MLVLSYVLWVAAAVFVVIGIASFVSHEDGLIGCLIVAVFLGAFGFGAHDSATAKDVPHPSAAQACSEASARPMPVPATLRTTKDDRLGTIYPCNYLLDMGFVPGKPAALMGKISEAVFTENNFRATSSWGGFLIFGTGGGGGSSKSVGSSVRHDQYAFMARTTDGDYTKVVVDSDSVRLATCAKCAPYVTMRVDNSPVYIKKRDSNKNDSIWLKFPGRLSSPGRMLQSLAHLVITLPRSLVPKPVA